MKNPKPFRPYSPKLAAFKTEKKLTRHLYEEYWGKGKTQAQIAKDLKISTSRVKELLERFHIRARYPGQRVKKT